MNNTGLVKKASEYVYNLFSTQLSDKYVYHNYEHTSDVVAAVKDILDHSNVNGIESEIVLLAAWFHDTGYINGAINHELKSSEIASQYLKEKNYPEEKINKVIKCILATKTPQNPQNNLEQILCDADLSHFGKKNFFDRMNLLRVELEQSKDKFFTDFDWLKQSLDVFTSHSFFTIAAKEKFGNQKSDNLVKLQKKFRKKTGEETLSATKIEAEKEKIALKKEKEQRPERGIETMFRITSTNHIDLSGMADNKANIMISINTILISIVVTILVRKLDSVSNQHLILPTFILLSVSLLCIIFATLATKPKITEGLFTTEDIKQKKVNLLFFGNFYNMKFEDFEWGMKEMMNDKEFLYGSMIKDFYFLGKVLGKKYKYLSICYNIFMYGMIAAIIAFLIAVITVPTDIGTIVE